MKTRKFFLLIALTAIMSVLSTLKAPCPEPPDDPPIKRFRNLINPYLLAPVPPEKEPIRWFCKLSMPYKQIIIYSRKC